MTFPTDQSDARYRKAGDSLTFKAGARVWDTPDGTTSYWTTTTTNDYTWTVGFGNEPAGSVAIAISAFSLVTATLMF